MNEIPPLAVATLENKYTNLKEADDLRRSYNEVEESETIEKEMQATFKLSDANRKLGTFKEESKEAEENERLRTRLLKGLSASDEIDDLRRKYEAECAKNKELERTIMNSANTLDKLQLLQKKTHANYLKDIERDHAKYQSELDALVFESEIEHHTFAGSHKRYCI